MSVYSNFIFKLQVFCNDNPQFKNLVQNINAEVNINSHANRLLFNFFLGTFQRRYHRNIQKYLRRDTHYSKSFTNHKVFQCRIIGYIINNNTC